MMLAVALEKSMDWNWSGEARTRVRTLAAQEAFITEGDQASNVYEVLEGIAIIYKIFQDGRRHVVHFAYPGDIVGFDQAKTFDFNCEALTVARIRCIPKTGLLAAALENPSFGQRLLDFAAGEISSARRLSTTLSRKTAIERVATFLLDLAGRRVSQCDRIPVPMSRTDIADYLGLTMETVSRNITKLRTLGIIDLPGASTVRILNETALRGLAECAELVH
tara:strand:- start:2231 stop:2893 length:663 start_codon:yes stop_codon:yes gene_type:complete|eukprot:jgi/Tetstr1/450288/TSEL_037324.t1